MEPKFFASPAAWRQWLEKNHARHNELLVGFYKIGCGKASISWPESVDEALCFGWIDGVRRRIDEVSYSIRFTPRKPASIWSTKNIKRMEELARQSLAQAAGLKAFAARQDKRSNIYAYEQQNIGFDDEREKRLQRNKKACAFFASQPAWYRRTATWWVVNAKREETKEKRFAKLLECSEEGKTLPHLTRRGPGAG